MLQYTGGIDVMFNDILVPMPESKALFRLHPNGSTYVYYTVAAYRNKAGKPTSKVKAIGKKDEKTKQLIPNKNYYIVPTAQITLQKEVL